MKPFKISVPFEKQTGQAVWKKRKKPVWSAAVLRVVGAFLARAVIFGGAAPFGVAFLGMERKLSPLAAVSLGFCAAGYACLGNPVYLRYIAACLLWMGLLALCGRKKEIPLPVAVLAVTGITVVTDFVQMLWLGADTKHLLLPAIDAVTVPLAMVLFDRLRRLLYERNLSAAVLTKEEKICFCAMVAIGLLGFRTIRIPDLFSVANYLGFLFLGIAAVSGGLLQSVSVGIAVGLLFGISGDLFVYLSAFGGTAFFCGMFGRKSKAETAGILCLTGGALCFYGLWNGADAVQLPEPVFAAVTLILLPREFFRIAGRFVDFSEKSAIEAGALAAVQTRLERASEAMRALAYTFAGKTEAEEDSGNYAALLDAACDHVCRGCLRHKDCHGEEFGELCDALMLCMGRLKANHSLTGEDVFLAFRGRCRQSSAMARELNRLFGAYRKRCLQKHALYENRACMGEQYRSLAELLHRTAISAGDETSFHKLAAEEVACRLQHEGIDAEDVQILRRADGGREVQLRCIAANDRTCRGICAVLHRVLGVSFSSAPTHRKGEYLKFYETPRFAVTAGYACVGKGPENGDKILFREIAGGKFVALLSDGMGTGEDAHRESETLIALLETFLQAGFGQDVALKLINSAMLMNAACDRFATVDLCVLDRYSGEAKFVKYGAAPGYIRSGTEVRTVQASAPPVGILPLVETEDLRQTLQKGDAVVMTTDGVELKTGENSWIPDMLASVPEAMPPRELADQIMEKALALKGGAADDDMSILVWRVE